MFNPEGEGSIFLQGADIRLIRYATKKDHLISVTGYAIYGCREGWKQM
jgi:hypothetical protein